MPNQIAHTTVIEKMSSLGFGLLTDGDTFYQKGYELNPRSSITFSMRQAYLLTTLSAQIRKEERQRLIREITEKRKRADVDRQIKGGNQIAQGACQAFSQVLAFLTQKEA